jgi:hypothetical protein
MTEAAFLVVINTDGTLSTIPLPPESDALPADNKVKRLATTADIYAACREIASDIDSSLLAQKVASMVLSSMQPTDEVAAMKQRMAEKLQERQ